MKFSTIQTGGRKLDLSKLSIKLLKVQSNTSYGIKLDITVK